PGVKLSPVPVGGMISGFFWNRKLVETVSTVAREQPDSVCYVRYAARFSPYVSCLARRLHGIPLVLEVNSFGAQRHRWMRTFDKHAMKAAHRVVVVSTLLAELIHESLRIPRSSILVLPNGVDLTRFRGASSVHRHDGRSIRIGYVGVLKENYGIEDLIRSMALLREEARSPAHELIVVGHGPARRSLERLASELDNVTFAGAVEPDEVPALLRSMDVLAYTSTRVNGFQSP